MPAGVLDVEVDRIRGWFSGTSVAAAGVATCLSSTPRVCAPEPLHGPGGGSRELRVCRQAPRSFDQVQMDCPGYRMIFWWPSLQQLRLGDSREEAYHRCAELGFLHAPASAGCCSSPLVRAACVFGCIVIDGGVGSLQTVDTWQLLGHTWHCHLCLLDDHESLLRCTSTLDCHAATTGLLCAAS